MSLLDSPNINTRKAEKIINLFASVTGEQTGNVYCTGYNTAYIFAVPGSSGFTMNLSSCNRDKVTRVVNNSIRALDISNVQGEFPQNGEVDLRDTTTIKSGAVKAYKVDVSSFYALIFTCDGEQEYTVNVVLTNETFDWNIYNNFLKVVTGKTLDGNNARFSIAGMKGNAVLLQLVCAGDVSANFAIRRNADITSKCVLLDNMAFLRTGVQCFTSGTHYIAVPIEKNATATSIFLSAGDGSTNISLYVQDFNFDFSSVTSQLYFHNVATAVGNSYDIPVPKGKSVAVVKATSSSAAKFSAFLSSVNNSTRTDVAEFGSCMYNVSSGAFVNAANLSFNGSAKYIIDVSNADFMSFSSGQNTSKFSLLVEFPETLKEIPSEIVQHGFKTLYSSSKFEVEKNMLPESIAAVYKDVVVWKASNYILVSTSGFNGARKKIVLNTTNFPNVKNTATIERVVIMPWTRNASNSYPGGQWRMNVIMSTNQVYHNFPSRNTSNDGSYVDGDEYKFDESVIWELPERFAPVQTNEGDDATLIATGVYRHLPGLPAEAYTFHPAISTDNGYNNGGFPAYTTKTNEEGQSVKFARWCHYEDKNNESNSFGFMGGFAANEKIAFLGTYKSNESQQVRICVFTSNDGGRQWFCRWESGSQAYTVDYQNNRVMDLRGGTIGIIGNRLANPLVLTGMSGYSGEGLKVRARWQSIPSAASKDNCHFVYRSQKDVSSITIDGNGNAVVTTASDHGFNNGDSVVFEHATMTSDNSWYWLLNHAVDTSENTDDGMVFAAKVTSTTTFTICAVFANPHNVLYCRHVHGINHCKDGWAISCGEYYPRGWLLWVPMYQSDAFARFYPWDKMDFVRLTSCATSVQRPLGFVIKQDRDNSVIAGVDNEYTAVSPASLPEGRNGATFRRSSQGVWKGPLVEIDDQANYNCIFESDQVCYLFKSILGMMIYLGQMGHLGMSLDDGETWEECSIGGYGVCRLAGNLPDGTIVIENYVIRKKI